MYKNMMGKNLLLKTDGFEWRLKIDRIDFNESYIYGDMILRVITQENEKDLGTVEYSLSFDDLSRLASYFNNHLKMLQHNPDHESDVFVSHLEFQIQALCGYIYCIDEGSFSIRIMLFSGFTINETRIYTGAEGSLDAENCKMFISEIEKLYSELVIIKSESSG